MTRNRWTAFAVFPALMAFAACTVESSSDVKTSRIHGQVESEYVVGGSTLTHAARFSVGNEFGNPISLQGDSSARVNDVTLIQAPIAALYTATQMVKDSGMKGLVVSSQIVINGQSFRNSFSFPSSLPAFESTTLVKKDATHWEIPWSAAGRVPGEVLTASIGDTSASGAGVRFQARVVESSLSSGVVVVTADNAAVVGMPMELRLQLRKVTPAVQQPEAGLTLGASHVTKVVVNPN